MANWSLGSSLRSGSISLKPAFSKNLVEVLFFIKMPCQLTGVGDKKDLEVVAVTIMTVVAKMVMIVVVVMVVVIGLRYFKMT